MGAGVRWFSIRSKYGGWPETIGYVVGMWLEDVEDVVDKINVLDATSRLGMEMAHVRMVVAVCTV